MQSSQGFGFQNSRTQMKPQLNKNDLFEGGEEKEVLRDRKYSTHSFSFLVTVEIFRIQNEILPK